jgi:spermidine/putrescine transport system substrate-binding protein
MDAMTQPEAGKWLIETNGYGHSNKKAFELVGDAGLAKVNLPKDPTVFFEKSVFQQYIPNADKVLKMYEEVRAGT